MGFEGQVSADILKDQINLKVYAKTYKERVHVSYSSISNPVLSKELGINETCFIKYANQENPRYLIAKELTSDLLLTVYDINSSSLFAARLPSLNSKESKIIHKAILKLSKKPFNLEARLIGMQNGQDISMLQNALHILAHNKIPVTEFDLFGDQIRHIAVDSKLGMTLNVLLLDRIYRPGELKNANADA